jgi:hypothetical protein
LSGAHQAALLDAAIEKRGGANVVVAKVQSRRRQQVDEGFPRKLQYVAVGELPDVDEQFDDELVEGMIGRNAMAVIYGDSNSGKTFFAVELASCVGLGGPFLGRNTAGGLVIYLATEAAESVKLRFRARRRHFGALPQCVIVVQSPINLFDGCADVAAILSLVRELESHVGEKAVLIIGDTLARISAGANENSGEDMGVVLKHADKIRSATGATFLWIHHTGKDQARGMRGWSGMRAAIDTEIEVTADEETGSRTAEITKQRDLPGKGERIGFRLEPVNLGRNRWGTPRGSCVVTSAEAAPKKPAGRRQSAVAGAIVELLNSRNGMKKADIVKHYAERYESATVYRELKKMLEDGRVHEVAGIYALRAALKSRPAP